MVHNIGCACGDCVCMYCIHTYIYLDLIYQMEKIDGKLSLCFLNSLNRIFTLNFRLREQPPYKIVQMDYKSVSQYMVQVQYFLKN